MLELLGKLKQWIDRKNTTPVDLSVYFIDEPHRYVQFKHACIGDYGMAGAKPTLTKCTCRLFQKTGLPCHHMYRVALDSGVYDELFTGHEDLIQKMESLSSTALAKLGDRIYGGWLESPRSISDFGRFGKQIQESGLIEVDGSEFLVSQEVRDNLYFVIHYIMSDDKFKKYRYRG